MSAAKTLESNVFGQTKLQQLKFPLIKNVNLL